MQMTKNVNTSKSLNKGRHILSFLQHSDMTFDVHGNGILKKLLCIFHIIQLVLFILVNHKPISGLMSAEILCWISIVN